MTLVELLLDTTSDPTMGTAKQSRDGRWGSGKSGGGNGNDKPPIHKPTKPRLGGLNSLQYVEIVFNASWQ